MVVKVPYNGVSGIVPGIGGSSLLWLDLVHSAVVAREESPDTYDAMHPGAFWDRVAGMAAKKRCLSAAWVEKRRGSLG